jgi:hypothetical protein
MGQASGPASHAVIGSAMRDCSSRFGSCASHNNSTTKTSKPSARASTWSQDPFTSISSAQPMPRQSLTSGGQGLVQTTDSIAFAMRPAAVDYSPCALLSGTSLGCADANLQVTHAATTGASRLPPEGEQCQQRSSQQRVQPFSVQQLSAPTSAVARGGLRFTCDQTSQQVCTYGSFPTAACKPGYSSDSEDEADDDPRHAHGRASECGSCQLKHSSSMMLKHQQRYQIAEAMTGESLACDAAVGELAAALDDRFEALMLSPDNQVPLLYNSLGRKVSIHGIDSGKEVSEPWGQAAVFGSPVPSTTGQKSTGVSVPGGAFP